MRLEEAGVGERLTGLVAQYRAVPLSNDGAGNARRCALSLRWCRLRMALARWAGGDPRRLGWRCRLLCSARAADHEHREYEGSETHLSIPCDFRRAGTLLSRVKMNAGGS